MTIALNDRLKEFTGDGSTTVFVADFEVESTSEAKAALIGSDGLTAEQTLSTHFTVSITAKIPTYTFVTAPPSGTKVKLYGSTPAVQSTNYTENDNFPSEAHEGSLDTVIKTQQEIRRDLGRIPKYPLGEAGATFPAAATRAGYIARFNATTGALEPSTTNDSVLGDLVALDDAALADIALAAEAYESSLFYTEAEVDSLLAEKADRATADRVITVGASGKDYATLAAAWKAVDDILNEGEYSIDIQLANDEAFSIDLQQFIRLSTSALVYLGGDPDTMVRSSALYQNGTFSQSGSAGAYTCEMEVAGWVPEVGDAFMIRDTAGTGIHWAVRGCFKVASVTPSGGNQIITFAHAGKGSWPTMTLTSAEIIHTIPKVVFTGTDAIDSYHRNRTDDPGGIEVGSGNLRLHTIAMFDETTIANDDYRLSGMVSAYYQGTLQAYNFVGMNGFKNGALTLGPAPGLDLRNVFIHGCAEMAVHSQIGATSLVATVYVSGCDIGLRANDHGGLYLSSCTAAMCNTNYSCTDGWMGAFSCKGGAAVNHDILVDDQGRARFRNFDGDDLVKVAGMSSLILEGTCAFDTLEVVESSQVQGAALGSMTINTKTYTKGVVDGVPYGGSYAFVAEGLASTTITSGDFVKVSPTEVADPDGAYSAGRFTAQEKGIYVFQGRGTYDAAEASATDAFAVIGRFKVYDDSAGTTTYRNIFRIDIAGSTKVTIVTDEGSAQIVLDVDDYVEFEFYQTSGTDQTAAGDATEWGFSGALVTGLV